MRLQRSPIPPPRRPLLGRRYLYVADLASLPAQRSKGYGKMLMAYMEDIACKAGCTRCARGVPSCSHGMPDPHDAPLSLLRGLAAINSAPNDNL